jgi:hypothetical protein
MLCSNVSLFHSKRTVKQEKKEIRIFKSKLHFCFLFIVVNDHNHQINHVTVGLFAAATTASSTRITTSPA